MGISVIDREKEKNIMKNKYALITIISLIIIGVIIKIFSMSFWGDEGDFSNTRVPLSFNYTLIKSSSKDYSIIDKSGMIIINSFIKKVGISNNYISAEQRNSRENSKIANKYWVIDLSNDKVIGPLSFEEYSNAYEIYDIELRPVKDYYKNK